MTVSLRAHARLLAFAFALVLFGAGPAELQTVRIGVLPNDDMMSVLYAQQSGMFKDAGLDVTIDQLIAQRFGNRGRRRVGQL